MKKNWNCKNTIFIVVLAVSIFAVFSCNTPKMNQEKELKVAEVNKTSTTINENTTVPKDLPKLLEFISYTCPHCINMMPTINEVTNEYSGRVDVIKVDIVKNYDALKKYNIEGTPTQIFFDPDGNVVYRFEGEMTHNEIEDVFREKFNVK